MQNEGWQPCLKVSTNQIFKVNFKNYILIVLLVFYFVKVGENCLCAFLELLQSMIQQLWAQSHDILLSALTELHDVISQ